jgi:large subunit ribosomal protein L25
VRPTIVNRDFTVATIAGHKIEEEPTPGAEVAVAEGVVPAEGEEGAVAVEGTEGKPAVGKEAAGKPAAKEAAAAKPAASARATPDRGKK